MYKKILKAMGSAGGYQQRQPGIIHTLRYTCSCTYMGLFMAHVIMVFYHVIMVSENPYHMVENPYHMVENPYHMVQKPCDTGIYLLCTNKRKIIKITLQVGQSILSAELPLTRSRIAPSIVIGARLTAFMTC